jgi:hypothetical protein
MRNFFALSECCTCMGFIHGVNRHEAILFPERLDDYIPKRGDQSQKKMREERETPSAMTYVCYRLLPCDRAR